MKIKIFEADSGYAYWNRSIEREVNDFIKDKAVVDVKINSILNDQEQEQITTIMVLYEENQGMKNVYSVLEDMALRQRMGPMEFLKRSDELISKHGKEGGYMKRK